MRVCNSSEQKYLGTHNKEYHMTLTQTVCRVCGNYNLCHTCMWTPCNSDRHNFRHIFIRLTRPQSRPVPRTRALDKAYYYYYYCCYYYCRTGNFCKHNLCVLVCDIILRKCIFAFLAANCIGNQSNKEIFERSIFAIS